MKAFMDKDFLLETVTAKHLYHDYAAGMPLVDYHCHISPRRFMRTGGLTTFERKGGWIDFDTGTVAYGESLDEASERLLDFILAAANGQKTCAELRGTREISIFKDGVVL